MPESELPAAALYSSKGRTASGRSIRPSSTRPSSGTGGLTRPNSVRAGGQRPETARRPGTVPSNGIRERHSSIRTAWDDGEEMKAGHGTVYPTEEDHAASRQAAARRVALHRSPKKHILRGKVGGKGGHVPGSIFGDLGTAESIRKPWDCIDPAHPTGKTKGGGLSGGGKNNQPPAGNNVHAGGHPKLAPPTTRIPRPDEVPDTRLTTISMGQLRANIMAQKRLLNELIFMTSEKKIDLKRLDNELKARIKANGKQREISAQMGDIESTLSGLALKQKEEELQDRTLTYLVKRTSSQCKDVQKAIDATREKINNTEKIISRKTSEAAGARLEASNLKKEVEEAEMNYEDTMSSLVSALKSRDDELGRDRQEILDLNEKAANRKRRMKKLMLNAKARGSATSLNGIHDDFDSAPSSPERLQMATGIQLGLTAASGIARVLRHVRGIPNDQELEKIEDDAKALIAVAGCDELDDLMDVPDKLRQIRAKTKAARREAARVDQRQQDLLEKLSRLHKERDEACMEETNCEAISKEEGERIVQIEKELVRASRKQVKYGNLLHQRGADISSAVQAVAVLSQNLAISLENMHKASLTEASEDGGAEIGMAEGGMTTAAGVESSTSMTDLDKVRDALEELSKVGLGLEPLGMKKRLASANQANVGAALREGKQVIINERPSSPTPAARHRPAVSPGQTQHTFMTSRYGATSPLLETLNEDGSEFGSGTSEVSGASTAGKPLPVLDENGNELQSLDLVLKQGNVGIHVLQSLCEELDKLQLIPKKGVDAQKSGAMSEEQRQSDSSSRQGPQEEAKDERVEIDQEKRSSGGGHEETADTFVEDNGGEEETNTAEEEEEEGVASSDGGARSSVAASGDCGVDADDDDDDLRDSKSESSDGRQEENEGEDIGVGGSSEGDVSPTVSGQTDGEGSSDLVSDAAKFGISFPTPPPPAAVTQTMDVPAGSLIVDVSKLLGSALYGDRDAQESSDEENILPSNPRPDRFNPSEEKVALVRGSPRKRARGKVAKRTGRYHVVDSDSD